MYDSYIHMPFCCFHSLHVDFASLQCSLSFPSLVYLIFAPVLLFPPLAPPPLPSHSLFSLFCLIHSLTPSLSSPPPFLPRPEWLMVSSCQSWVVKCLMAGSSTQPAPIWWSVSLAGMRSFLLPWLPGSGSSMCPIWSPAGRQDALSRWVSGWGGTVGYTAHGDCVGMYLL